MSVELVPVPPNPTLDDLRKAVNRMIERDRGEHGGRQWLRGDDGVHRNTRGGAVISTGVFSQIAHSKASGGPHFAAVLSATAVTAAPTLGNSAVHITDAGVLIGAGKGLRAYDAAGIDYTEITADADGGMVVGGSGAAAGRVSAVSTVLSGFWSVGTNPATTGAGRLANALAINARNAANSADIGVIQTNASNHVLVGDIANSPSAYVQALTDVRLKIGATEVVTQSATTTTFNATGARIAADFSNGTITNKLLFQSSTTNGFTYLGALPNGTSQNCGMAFYNTTNPAAAAWVDILVTAGLARIYSGHTGSAYLPLVLYTNGGETLRLGTDNSVSFGSSVASTGRIRLPNAQAMYARNAANSADIHMMGTDGSDQIGVGQTGNTLVLQGTVTVPVIDPPTVATQVTAGSQCKAFAFVTGGGGATLGDNYNITSVTRNAAGDFTLTFDRDFNSTNYAVLVTVFDNAAFLVTRVNGKAAGTCDIHFYTPAGVATDPDGWSAAVFGTLA